jgi:hypothetical protein
LFRYRRLIAMAIGLLPLMLPMPAHAARGSFVYWSVAPGGNPSGERHELNDPPAGTCENLVTSDQTGTQVVKVRNGTDTPATVYEQTGCTGHRLVVAAGQTRSAGGHGPHSFNSVKFQVR